MPLEVVLFDVAEFVEDDEFTFGTELGATLLLKADFVLTDLELGVFKLSGF